MVAFDLTIAGEVNPDLTASRLHPFEVRTWGRCPLALDPGRMTDGCGVHRVRAFWLTTGFSRPKLWGHHHSKSLALRTRQSLFLLPGRCGLLRICARGRCLPASATRI